MTVVLLIIGLVSLLGLVVVHEWGHFVAARRGGVEVEEFGVGFPPKIWSKKVKTEKSKFDFSVNLLPLGGFVRLKGESDDDERPGSFGAAPLNVKVKILLAGVGMNALVAFILFTILAATGMPQIVENQFSVSSDAKVVREVKDKDVVLVGKIVDNSPAQKAGLQENDRIIKINDQSITGVEAVSEATKQNAGKTIPIIIERNGNQMVVGATLNTENKGDGYLGVASASGRSGIEQVRSTWSSPIVAAGLIKQFSELTFKHLGIAVSSLFKGDTKTASEQVSGPVGVVYIFKEGGKLGLSFIIMIIAIISLTLALMNILPIPALDGGRLFVMLAFRAAGQKLTKAKEELIHGAGFAVLMILFVLITIADVKRFF
ncbi:site-2 protease family protein [Candidatus Saccharibacteria bacterium]|nr:site-2 protease family protein [Candidatus Saccharibacteria bacterium]